MKSSRMQGNPAWFIVSIALALALYSCGGGGGGDTSPPPPTTITAAATAISLHTATINATVNPHAQATTAWFEWGTDNALASPTLTAAQAIGDGSTDNAVSATLTGLTLGTTYYYRVSATNAQGTQKGTIASFTTALPNSPPTVSTNAATSVTVSGAVLNGTVSPNELATSAAFEWGTDSTLTVLSGTTTVQSLGSGSTSVAITAPLSGLTPGVTYYFRVTATNAAGTSKGTIANFTAVAQAPTVTTAAPTSVTTSGGTLNGSVNPNGFATSAYFEYGTDLNLSTFSTTAPQPLGSGTIGVAVQAVLSGLDPGVKYYFRVTATNSVGTSRGAIVNFDTIAQAPTSVTLTATSITASGGTLKGTVNPNGLAVTDAHFEYGTDSNLSTFTTIGVQTLPAGFSAQEITADLTGRPPGTTHYFRIAATNSVGTTKGLILSFSTVAPPPTVVNLAADPVTSSSATLNGTVNPNGLATDGYFEWGTDQTLGVLLGTTSTQAMGSGGSAAAIAAPVSGLSPDTTYYFRVVATNAGGTVKGNPILSFKTPLSPAVTTEVPTSITTTSAVFHGTVNPNGLLTEAWFEYGTNPSSLTSSTVHQGGLSGTSPLSYSKSVPGLSPYTTYYYRAAASNPGGSQTGNIKSFKTGETYVAVGDSITAGSDGTTLIGGYEPILADLLGVMIANKGVSGHTSADGAAAIGNTLSSYPSAQYYLILYGTNDAFIPAVPSGLGLNPGDPGYSGSYKYNMQQIISAILGAGKTPYLAKVPYTTDVRISDASIRDYNFVIDELRSSNGITVPAPNFYSWFQSNPSQLADGIHPNGTGYQAMADLWFNALP